MVDADIVQAKVGNIQRCLHRIREITELKPERLDTLLNQDAFVLNLQRAAQSCIDLAAHVVASEGAGLPQDLKENFTLLAQAGIIEEKIAEQMKKMVGFRNVAVHEYQNITVEVLKRILTDNLKDLEIFYTQILKYFKL